MYIKKAAFIAKLSCLKLANIDTSAGENYVKMQILYTRKRLLSHC